jgi:hypothetical protein
MPRSAQPDAAFAAGFGRNRLLAALAPDDLARLRPHLEPVSLRLGEAPSDPGQPIAYVLFPEAGIVSVLAVAPGGRSHMRVLVPYSQPQAARYGCHWPSTAARLRHVRLIVRKPEPRPLSHANRHTLGGPSPAGGQILAGLAPGLVDHGLCMATRAGTVLVPHATPPGRARRR